MEFKNAIAFLNLSNDDEFLKNTYPDLYYDIINEFCKYKQNRELWGLKIIEKFKYYKLT